MPSWWAQLDRDVRDRYIAFLIAGFCGAVAADIAGGLIELDLLGDFAIRLVVFVPAALVAHMGSGWIRRLRDGSTDLPSDGA
jgi:hypothetical protein